MLMMLVKNNYHDWVIDIFCHQQFGLYWDSQVRMKGHRQRWERETVVSGINIRDTRRKGAKS
jgi:hypothetical protein